MLNLNEIKTGKKILFNQEPYLVLFDQHSKTGRAGAVLRTKLKNLITGATINKNFQGADKVAEAVVEKGKAQFLYSDETGFNFMNNENYEQFSLDKEVIGQAKLFLKEGTEVDSYFFNGQPINIELPIKMEFEVVESPPAVRGNTVDGGSKQVTLDTGLQVCVPLFINKGDILRVNTTNGEYVERAK